MRELDHKEGWAPKNWWFWTVVLEKTLERPLDSKEIKPVNPKGNQPWIFTEKLLLKLKLQYLGHLMQRANSLVKTLMLGKVEVKRRRGWQRMRWWDSITNSMDVNLSKLGEIMEGRETWCAAVHGAAKSQTQLSNRTTTTPKNSKTPWTLFMKQTKEDFESQEGSSGRYPRTQALSWQWVPWVFCHMYSRASSREASNPEMSMSINTKRTLRKAFSLQLKDQENGSLARQKTLRLLTLLQPSMTE